MVASNHLLIIGVQNFYINENTVEYVYESGT